MCLVHVYLRFSYIISKSKKNDISNLKMLLHKFLIYTTFYHHRQCFLYLKIKINYLSTKELFGHFMLYVIMYQAIPLLFFKFKNDQFDSINNLSYQLPYTSFCGIHWNQTPARTYKHNTSDACNNVLVVHDSFLHLLDHCFSYSHL